MKKKRTVANIKLGIFVLAGLIFLVFSLYMIGKNRNIFGSTFTLSAQFRNINGLVTGSNVRFAGIDVGTVRSISVESDTSVLVTMVIDRKMKNYIKKNALASIGTDGLVGNKIVNINSVKGTSESADDGDMIGARLPVETDEMLRTLQTTNSNIAVITDNLKDVSERLSGSTNLWNILSDTIIVRDFETAVHHIRKAGSNTQAATEEALALVKKLSSGEGLANTVFVDTSVSSALRRSIKSIEVTTKEIEFTATELQSAVNGIRKGQGSLGVILSDSVSASKLARSISNIEQGTEKFNENMEAMKGNFLFRGYYKKQGKN